MFRGLHPIVLAAGVALVPVFSGTSEAAFIVTNVGGDSNPSSIQSAVDSFRTELGDPNNGNAPGPLDSGRREINWDGGGATTATASGTPLTAFTDIRGATFTTGPGGTGFLQTPLNDPALLSINSTYGTTFNFFSPLRIFTPVGSNVTDATFSVPGTNGAVPATVSGFGAVFTNVALAGVTRMDFFDTKGADILSLAVAPGSGTGSLSFLGAVATAGEEIAEVRITTGTTALGPNDNPAAGVNVVAMDDFLYKEPVAVIPEPASLTLMGLGLAGIVGLGLYRRNLRHRRSS